MYEKELKALEDRVALLKDDDKKTGEKKIKAADTLIDNLQYVVKDSPLYKQSVEKIETLLSWEPGKKSGGGGKSTYGNKVRVAFGQKIELGRSRYEKVFSFYSDTDDTWDQLIDALSKIPGFTVLDGKDFFRPSNSNLDNGSGKWGKVLVQKGNKITILSTDLPVD
jgi:hypothetical protein